jgi:hypothetical protein
MVPDVRTVAMDRCNASLCLVCPQEQGDEWYRRSGIRHEPRGTLQVRLLMGYESHALSGATGKLRADTPGRPLAIRCNLHARMLRKRLST